MREAAPSAGGNDHFLAEIEILRAVAVLFTVGQHMVVLLSWTQWAIRAQDLWGGVDLFFCISGFVIIRSLKGDGWPGPGGRRALWSLALPFWIRRIFRILPAAWLWLALPLLATISFNRSGAFGTVADNIADGLAALLQVANFHWLGCLHFGIGRCNTSTWVLGTYWSLSLEEQFYVLLPLILSLLPKRAFALVIAIGAATQFVLPRPAWAPLWAVRTDALLLGVALGLWQGHASHARLEPCFLAGRRWQPLVPALGVVLIWLFPGPLSALRLSTGLLALACAGLVFLASYGRGYILPAGPLRSLLMWIGARSYGIYLIHLPTFCLCRELWFRMTGPIDRFTGPTVWGLVLTAPVLVVVLVEANFRLVEGPLRRRGRRLAGAVAARLGGGKGVAGEAPALPLIQ